MSDRIGTVRAVSFSPTGSTRRVLRGIAAGIGAARVQEDSLDRPAWREAGVQVGADELLLVGMPVYAGRVPGLFHGGLPVRGTGDATDDRPSLRATVICAGGENCGKRFDYQGIQTCAAAASIAGGPSACAYGCLGLGDCTRACKFDAIHIINGVAVVDRKKCTGCTACTVTCPRHVIQMKPIAPQPAVMCSNKDKGALVNKTCKVGCIACGLCVRNCPNQAIFLKDNVAVIDYTKCNGCGTCVSKCPKKAIQWVEGTPRPIDAPVPAHEVLKTRV